MQAAYQAKLEQQFQNYLTAYDLKGKGEGELKASNESFAQLSKEISQLIARSWLPNDPKGADIKGALLKGDSEEIKTVFNKYGVDLDKFFSPMTVNVSVDWDTFFGTFSEVTGPEQPLEYNLPYPPRPMEVTDAQLSEWVHNSDPSTIYPPYPYIPLSAS